MVASLLTTVAIDGDWRYWVSQFSYNLVKIMLLEKKKRNEEGNSTSEDEIKLWSDNKTPISGFCPHIACRLSLLVVTAIVLRLAIFSGLFDGTFVVSSFGRKLVSTLGTELAKRQEEEKKKSIWDRNKISTALTLSLTGTSKIRGYLQ